MSSHSPDRFPLKRLLAACLVGWTVAAGAQPAPLPATTEPAGTSLYANGSVQRKIEQTRTRRMERSYFPSSVLQRETIWDMNGKTAVPVSDRQYSSSGVLLSERRWACGELVLEAQYLATGVLVSKKELMGQGATREMHTQEYLATGVLVSEQRHAVLPNGRTVPVGLQRQMDASGRPVREQNYDDQGRLLEEKTWNAAGEVSITRGGG